MIQVNVTEFRNHLPIYLSKVKGGEEVALTTRGTVVARLVPQVDESLKAREWLASISSKSWVGDVTTPLDEEWEALRDTP
jgi:antitoxin (DNA-binding transcriptional repressor) of toxin-antitoxin stability system